MKKQLLHRAGPLHRCSAALTIVVAITALVAVPAGAQGVIDQENDVAQGHQSASCGTAMASLYQSFTPVQTPLIAVELRTSSTTGVGGNAGNSTVRIRLGAPDGAILAETTTALAPDWFRVEFGGPGGVAVTPGQLYLIEWVEPPSWFITVSDTYPGGTSYGCTANLIPSRDFCFRTYTMLPLPVEDTTWGAVKALFKE